MSDSVLKQELRPIEVTREDFTATYAAHGQLGYSNVHAKLHACERERREALLEVHRLTLLSDSQLANQERLTEELARVRDRIEGISRLDNAHPVTHALRLLADFNISVGKACEFIRHYMLDGSVDPITEEAQPYDEILDDVAASEIARRWRASEAELATERANQERLVGEMQELRQVVKEYLHHPASHHSQCHGGNGYHSCELCKRSRALLAKDTPTEPKSAPEDTK